MEEPPCHTRIEQYDRRDVYCNLKNEPQGIEIGVAMC